MHPEAASPLQELDLGPLPTSSPYSLPRTEHHLVLLTFTLHEPGLKKLDSLNEQVYVQSVAPNWLANSKEYMKGTLQGTDLSIHLCGCFYLGPATLFTTSPLATMRTAQALARQDQLRNLCKKQPNQQVKS